MRCDRRPRTRRTWPQERERERAELAPAQVETDRTRDQGERDEPEVEQDVEDGDDERLDRERGRLDRAANGAEQLELRGEVVLDDPLRPLELRRIEHATDLGEDAATAAAELVDIRGRCRVEHHPPGVGPGKVDLVPRVRITG